MAFSERRMRRYNAHTPKLSPWIIIGICVGRAASIFVSEKMGWPVATSVEAMILSVSVAAAIGIIFGWYPAWKASKLDPIDALHHE